MMVDITWPETMFCCDMTLGCSKEMHAIHAAAHGEWHHTCVNTRD